MAFRFINDLVEVLKDEFTLSREGQNSGRTEMLSQFSVP